MRDDLDLLKKIHGLALRDIRHEDMDVYHNAEIICIQCANTMRNFPHSKDWKNTINQSLSFIHVLVKDENTPSQVEIKHLIGAYYRV